MELTEELDWMHVDFTSDVEEICDLLRAQFNMLQRQLDQSQYSWSMPSVEFLLRHPYASSHGLSVVRSVIRQVDGVEITFEAEEDEDFDYLLAVCYTAFREVGLTRKYQPALRHHFGNYWTCTIVD